MGPDQRERIHSRSRQVTEASKFPFIQAKKSSSTMFPPITCATLPSWCGRPWTPTSQAQRGLAAACSRRRSLPSRPGEPVKPERTSRYLEPATGRSTVNSKALQPSACAWSSRLCMNPRSRIMYSWNQNGFVVPRATSSRGQADIVDKQNGTPCASAARAAWTSPRRAVRPARPTGAKASGRAIGWPNRSVVRSRVDTSCNTRCRKATLCRSATLCRRVTSE